MQDELLRLFHAVKITDRHSFKIPNYAEIYKLTIPYGFIFCPCVIKAWINKDLYSLIYRIKKQIMVSPEQLNSSFHKSWEKVQNASLYDLFIEQTIHYLTTYDLEAIGVNKEYIYIPNERLDIPDVGGSIPLLIIKGYNLAQIKVKILKLLESGLALKENTIKDILEIIKYLNADEGCRFDNNDLSKIKNKEVESILFQKLNILPEIPVKFLRYVLFICTGKTLLIKNKATINSIKNIANKNYSKEHLRLCALQGDIKGADAATIYNHFFDIGRGGTKQLIPMGSYIIRDLFESYREKYGFERLSTIFYRFKPLFLALRHHNGMKKIVNRIRRLAKSNHVPVKPNYSNSITEIIKKGIPIEIGQLLDSLKDMGIFQKIRLANSLKYRSQNVGSMLYRVRNGKSYAVEYNTARPWEYQEIFIIVYHDIIYHIEQNIMGKRIYIPEYINYALPNSEKQFSGMYPSGTYITVPKNMVVAIHWDNVEDERIDLDLSMISDKYGKIGWNSTYRSFDKQILFSGDMTDASGENGASECFYVKNEIEQESLMVVNYYNYKDKIEVPFKLIVGQGEDEYFKKNYMINPNNVLCNIPMEIKTKQNLLGSLITSKQDNRFYFCETSIGKTITSRNYGGYLAHASNYLILFYKNVISFNDIFNFLGRLVTDKKNADIDLSPETLEKDTFLSLLKKIIKKICLVEMG